MIDAKITYESLSKIQKVAYFFIIIGPEAAAPIIKQFDESTIEEICREMAGVSMIDKTVQVQLIEEFSRIVGHSLEGVLGGVVYAQKTLELAEGDYKAEAILDRVLQDSSCSKVTKELESMEIRQIFNLIQYEQSQTIAFVISGLGLSRGVELLSLFQNDKKQDILIKLGSMEKTSVDIIEKIVKTLLKEKRRDANTRNVDANGGPVLVANLLNALDRDTQKHLLADLEVKDPSLTNAIQKHMFKFEDLSKLTKEDLQKITRGVDMSDLVVALKSASQALREALFGSMSKRAAEALQEEIDALGPVRLKNIETAREKVIQIVRQLEQKGEITIGNSDENRLIK